MHVPTPTPTVDPAPSVSTLRNLSCGDAEGSACVPSPTIPDQRVNPSDDSAPLRFPDDKENHGLCINRTWVDTHASLLHTDHGLYVSVRGIQDADEPDGKRSRDEAVQSTRSKVARLGLQDDAATASHTESELYESQLNSLLTEMILPLQLTMALLHHFSTTLLLWPRMNPPTRKTLRMRHPQRL